ncbi:MAG: type VI secretion system TssO [Bacteroidetes bacterium]|nr:type VI secretion system TssO [Bacteroidota bacterium]
MKPLNKKERTGIYIKFLAAFIIGILIILIPFYFILRLPKVEEGLKNEDYRNMQGQIRFQHEFFSVQIDSVKRMIDKFYLPNQDIDKLNADIGALLSGIEKPFVNDTTWSGRMYKNVISSYIDLKKAKNDLLKAVKQLKDCQGDLDKAKADAKNKDTMGG